MIYDNKSMTKLNEEVAIDFNSKAKLEKDSNSRLIWTAITDMKRLDKKYSETFLKNKYFYLIKFTIKAKGLPEEIIYQGSALPTSLGYEQR